MTVRTGLLLLCVAVAGCARAPAPATASRAAGPAAAAAPAFERLPGSPAAPATRLARLPDRGELVAYPGRAPRPDGAYTWFRSEISEAHARHAIADGHLRLTTPEGRPIDVRYDRHVNHPSGDWTWIGHLPGNEGAQTIITFGERAVFGSIAQPDGAPPLRLTTRDGLSWIVETDPAKAASIVNSATRPTKPDYFMVPHAPGTTGGIAHVAAAQATTAAATASGATTVDLLIGYTAGLVTRLGSVSAVNTRLNNLVDIANAAYANSQVNAQVRLVHTMQVSYRDDNSNNTALQALSGKTSSGGTGTVDPAFSALRAAREKYGADLVSLVRPFLTGTGDQGGCGLAWLIGGGLEGTNLPSGIDSFAYSVVGDGEDYDETDQKTYYCRDESLAHEMGHNEGSAHDRTTAQGTDGVLNNPDDYGAFTYSFGYRNTTTVNVGGGTYHGFYTVMAYGDSTTYQYAFRVFSNPRITICAGHPCGTTTNEDNARSLAQMIPVIATFRSTVVPLGAVRSDFNGDGRSDILWRNYASGADAIWRGANSATPQAIAAVTDTRWKIVGTGDFDGDGVADILWRNAATGANVIWRSGSSSTPMGVTAVTNLAWEVVGVGDMDADGHADIVWRNRSTGANTVWRSGNSGAVLAVTSVSNLAWKIVAVADFDGDGHADLLWRNTSTGANVIWRSGNSAAVVAVSSVGDTHWTVAGAGDFNGDGRADIVWRNVATGTDAIWRSGDSRTPQAVSTVRDPAWKIVGVGDYDGDTRADLLWRNTSTGANTVWKTGNSATPLAVSAVGDQNWRIAP